MSPSSSLILTYHNPGEMQSFRNYHRSKLRVTWWSHGMEQNLLKNKYFVMVSLLLRVTNINCSVEFQRASYLNYADNMNSVFNSFILLLLNKLVLSRMRTCVEYYFRRLVILSPTFGLHFFSILLSYIYLEIMKLKKDIPWRL